MSGRVRKYRPKLGDMRIVRREFGDGRAVFRVEKFCEGWWSGQWRESPYWLASNDRHEHDTVEAAQACIDRYRAYKRSEKIVGTDVVLVSPAPKPEQLSLLAETSQ